METIDIVVDGILHQASLHRSMGPDLHRTIVYYHGGGFIFGDKDDLPAYAIKRFTEAGYDLLCMEYPKAPEMSLEAICAFVEKQLQWFLNNCDRLHLSKTYILFGRSAGGYIALMLAKRMIAMRAHKPYKIIVFYGYESFDSPDFNNPSEYYLKYPKLSWTDVRSSVGDGPIIKTNLFKRYPLYIYARQTGNWLKLLGINQHNLLMDQVFDHNEYPEIFFASSRYDQDVNYEHTIRMNSEYKNSTVFTSNQLIHEFDQVEGIETENLYKNLLEWLINVN